MENDEEGHSVQAVRVMADGSFEVDEEAVRRIVTRDEARGLPVAVVAVAGATRGGKSFLLDFFLRYLHAPPKARNDGSWLGADDEPLSGFSWRGGCERDTIGILIWSKPIIITLESGEQVAVLLMDTQGTFDAESTFRESTTIFALSTLLSSTQIYNLSQNIKEDDLEYLQFFTEYGKMASGGGEKPFQVLQFLVRDWSYAYQHPIGSVGGQNLLDTRLQEKNCKEELKEIRQQIKASFESVRCFLMPHPGLKVATNPSFVGCLADITKEFKSALLDLTSLLFHPNNLVLKNINGQSILIEELLEYLKTYVAVFNSDELPTPVNILKATGEASLEVSAMFARNVYHGSVQRATCSRAVARAAVPRAHVAALRLAREEFTARKMLVTSERRDQRLEELLMELEANLPQYMTINEEKLRTLFAECEAIFEGRLQQSSCLTPTELVEVHREAVDAAMAHFDDVLYASDDDEGIDEDRSPLLKKLEDNFSKFEAENETRIRDVIIKAKSLYETELLRGSTSDSSRVCASPNRLERRHHAARLDTDQYFTAHFTSAHNANNQHRDELMQYIERRWSELSMVNATNNDAAVKQAVEYYDDNMNELFSDSKCVHPSYLHSEHTKVRQLTIIKFNDVRTEISDEDEEDCYVVELELEMEIHHKKLKELNWSKNDEAVQKAHALYKRMMNITEGLVGAALAVVTSDTNVLKHPQVKRDVMNVFDTEYRRESNVAHSLDVHRKQLSDLIDESYKWLMLKMLGALSLSAINAAAMGSFIFRR